MSRHDLTDTEFNVIRHLLPSRCSGRLGRPWVNHLAVLNGILWILKTGSPWRDLPEKFGKWQTVYKRLCMWIGEGLRDRLMGRLLKRLDVLAKLTVAFGAWTAASLAPTGLLRLRLSSARKTLSWQCWDDLGEVMVRKSMC